jgi:GxxExxY protein
MPIHHTLKLRNISDQEFEAIDSAVMQCCYASRRHFGTLFDERVYENDIAARLRAEGFEVHTQVPVTVSHGSFQKTYFLDLVVNQMLYELKVAVSLIGGYYTQALNYAMLQDIRLVKVINLGGEEVRGRLRCNALSQADRHRPTMRKSGWKMITPHCEQLINHLKALIQDWGTHLDNHLYNEALIHQFGGEPQCIQRMELHSGGLKLGTHRVQCYSPNHAFVITGFSGNQPHYQQHLEVLMQHAPLLKGLQWINLNRSRMEVTTLERPGNG